jgi:hypothetical protein
VISCDKNRRKKWTKRKECLQYRQLKMIIDNHSLLKKQKMKKNLQKKEDKAPEKEVLPGYPEYSPDEDIYSTEEKESLDDDILPGEVPGKKVPPLDEDLDVPGSELDDADEIIGNEDEENNFYSLGGDDHNDLDEDKDE